MQNLETAGAAVPSMSVLKNELRARLYSRYLMRAIRMRRGPAIAINCAASRGAFAGRARARARTKRRRKKLEISSGHSRRRGLGRAGRQFARN